ncbi:MAG: hypothetical protein AAFN80_04285 [Pseudomonadota bacterium]
MRFILLRLLSFMALVSLIGHPSYADDPSSVTCADLSKAWERHHGELASEFIEAPTFYIPLQGDPIRNSLENFFQDVAEDEFARASQAIGQMLLEGCVGEKVKLGDPNLVHLHIERIAQRFKLDSTMPNWGIHKLPKASLSELTCGPTIADDYASFIGELQGPSRLYTINNPYAPVLVNYVSKRPIETALDVEKAKASLGACLPHCVFRDKSEAISFRDLLDKVWETESSEELREICEAYLQ